MNKIKFRKALSVLRTVLIVAALLLLIEWSWSVVNATAPYYTSWDFHECYAATFDAPYCTKAVVQTTANIELNADRATGGYEYYSPVFHILSRLLFWLPVHVSLRVVGALVFVSLFVVLAIGTRSCLLAPAALFFASPHLWATFLKGGTIPFYIFLLSTLIVFCFWDKMSLRFRLLILIVTLFTHNAGALFFSVMVVIFWVLPQKYARSITLFGAMFVSNYLQFNWAYPEYRGWTLVILLGAVYFGEALAWLKTKVIKRRLELLGLWLKCISQKALHDTASKARPRSSRRVSEPKT